LYIQWGINGIEEIFGRIMREVKDDSEEEKSLNEQQCIYNFISLVHHIDFAIESKLINNFKWNILEKDFKLLLSKMLQSTKVSCMWVECICLTYISFGAAFTINNIIREYLLISLIFIEKITKKN